jgi:hypothetical protein
VLGEGSTAVTDIRIWADKANRQLFIRDRGIGMTQVRGSNPKEAKRAVVFFSGCVRLHRVCADKANMQLFGRNRGRGFLEQMKRFVEILANVSLP